MGYGGSDSYQRECERKEEEKKLVQDGKPSNPKDRAATTRLDISLFPQSAIILGAMGMTEGDCKYAGYNYREAGVSVSTYMAALDRHKFKFYNGEWADKKSKVPHLGSMLSCIAIIIDGFVQGNIIDDRPPAQDIDALLSEAEKIVAHLQKLYPNGPKRITAKKKSGLEITSHSPALDTLGH